MDNILITVVIPIYNSESTLEKCVRSVIDQTYSNLEIFLINDGSTDNSIKICKKLRAEDDRIKIFDKTNSGVSDCRNLGLLNAHGHYISFLDSDDYLDTKLYEFLANLVKQNDYDMIQFLYFVHEKETTRKYKVGNFCEDMLLTDDQIMKHFLDRKRKILLNNVWSKLFKTSVAKNIRFDCRLQLSEDEKFSFDYLMLCNSVLFTPYYGYHYSVLDNTLCHTNNTKRLMNLIDSGIYLLDKSPLKYKNCVKERNVSYCISVFIGLDEIDEQTLKALRLFFIKNMSFVIFMSLKLKQKLIALGIIFAPRLLRHVKYDLAQ